MRLVGWGDGEVKDGPDEREAAGLAGESADDLGAAFDLAERPFEQVRAAPPAAVAGRVAQMHDERVEVVGDTSRRGGVAGWIEVADQRLESLPSVALADGVVEGLPVGLADALALALGHLLERSQAAVNPHQTRTPSLGPSARTQRKTASTNSAASWMS
jgi:hypothetical protein